MDGNLYFTFAQVSGTLLDELFEEAKTSASTHLQGCEVTMSVDDRSTLCNDPVPGGGHPISQGDLSDRHRGHNRFPFSLVRFPDPPRIPPQYIASVINAGITLLEQEFVVVVVECATDNASNMEAFHFRWDRTATLSTAVRLWLTVVGLFHKTASAKLHQMVTIFAPTRPHCVC